MKEPGSDKLIRKIFLDTIIALSMIGIIGTAITVIDGMMMSNFIGGDAIAAASLVHPLNQLMQMMVILITIGLQTQCSTALFRGDSKTADNLFTVGTAFAAGVALIITSASFFFSDAILKLLGAGHGTESFYSTAKTYLLFLIPGFPFFIGNLFLTSLMPIVGQKFRSFISTIVMLFTNVIGNLLAIFVFKAGIAGIGLATSLSHVAAFAVLVRFFFKRECSLKLKIQNGIEWNELTGLLKIGFPGLFAKGVQIISVIFVNSYVISKLGSTTFAGYSVFYGIKSFVVELPIGIGFALQAMTWMFVEEKDERGFLQLIRSTFFGCVVICGSIGLLCALFASPIAHFYGNGPHIDTSIIILKIYFYTFIVDALKCAVVYYLRGIKAIRLSLYSSIVAEGVLRIVPCFLLYSWIGAVGIWISIPLGQFIYLCAMLIIAAVKNKHRTHSILDMLFLPDSFFEPVEKFSASIKDKNDAVACSKSVHDFCLEHGISSRNSYFAALAVEEVTMNILKHGFRKTKNRALFIDVFLKISDGTADIRIDDNCVRFNPGERYKVLGTEDPTKNIGIRMLYALTDRISYTYTMGMNNLKITFSSLSFPNYSSTL